VARTNDFKLVGVELVEEGNRHAHRTKVVHRNLRYLTNLNGIVVDVLRVLGRSVLLEERQLLPVLLDFQSCEPDRHDVLDFLAVYNLFVLRAVRHFKPHIGVNVSVACPDSVLLQQRKQFGKSDGVLVPDDQKLLAILDKLSDVFAE